MKNLKFKMLSWVLGVCSIATLVSCSEENRPETLSRVAPSIENISLAQNDSLVEQGTADNMYIIRGKGFLGTQKIFFNETDTYFNSTLITDNVILVTINRNTPYAEATDEIRIVTPKGVATYHFIVAPPAPAIDSYSPINPSAGQNITIKGSFFLDPVVTFGTIPAAIVSSTLTEIVVTVPPGADMKHVIVSTISGHATSWEAIGTAIFDDVWYNGWDDEGSGADYITDITTRQGSVYLESTNGAWSGNQFRDVNWGTLNISNYSGIRFSVKGRAGDKIAVIINGNWNDNQIVAVTVTDKWQDVEIKWSQYPFAVTGLQSLVIKEFTGNASVYQIDDIGFTLTGE